MVESSQQTALYGPVDSKGTSRFQIIGDGRLMYPIYMAGSLHDSGWSPKIARGAYRQCQNLMVRGDQICALGGTFTDVTGTPTTLSLRLGTAANTGNNTLTSGNFLLYGFPYSVRRLDSGIHSGLMVNGEAFFQDTKPTVPQLGCASEAFTIAGTVGTVTLGSSTIVGVGTAFTTAALSFGYGYTPSLNIPRAGDIIRIVQGGNNYYHRIIAITDATHLEIFPKWGRQIDNLTANGATSAGPAAGLTYALSRTGYGSYSRIVSIYRDDVLAANQIFYNYYVGNHFSRALPGTIQCFTREASGAAASTHYMCPQTSAAQDIKAQDIVYYKNIMLYGYGTSIGWSKAGFPQSFPFDPTDFPAGNITVVANDDQFISFEMLGDQLLAIFRHSIWEIQATGDVPEFNFYRLPEPMGAYLGTVADPYGSAGIMHYRPTCSGRNAVYYLSRAGVLQLAGRTATKISENMHAEISSAYFSASGSPGSVAWDHSSDSLILSRGSGLYGHIYRVPDQTWSTLAMLNTGYFTGPMLEAGNGLDLVFYSSSSERLVQMDSAGGAPFNLVPGGSLQWAYQSPVLFMGDQYGTYQFAGFQLEGVYGAGISYAIYGGSNPWEAASLAHQRDTGTLGASTEKSNRLVYGKKVDDPFIAFFLFGTVTANLSNINVYALALGN